MYIPRRYAYVSPTNFLELLPVFMGLIIEQRTAMAELRSKLEIGREKLQATASEVVEMQAELQKLQPVLAATQLEAENMMLHIDKEKVGLQETREVVGKQEINANVAAAQAKAIADDAQADLDKALPALDEALVSLKNLSRNDVVEVKTMNFPPDGVKMVMEACCIMFDYQPRVVIDPQNPRNKVGCSLLTTPRRSFCVPMPTNPLDSNPPFAYMRWY